MLRSAIAIALTMLLLIACAVSAPQREEATPESQVAAELAEPVRIPAALTADKIDELTSKLAGTTDLTAAAHLLAIELNVPESSLRVRVEANNCTMCNVESNRELGSLEGLSVARGQELIAAGQNFWIFYEGVICYFTF